ncbi:cell division protein FtsQ/DivIB [Actinotalea sp. Marseille-Q4924]|uniref:cell division protein FtsQ/DivIB n=1 Tax=Actinotalea sp. Marseille-Q4924 TaxID=2866571 RepID=UPI0027155CAF|nr:cell division protein FtsQ/DivIB [Actinotalea sp. Marseille-Q4924]
MRPPARPRRVAPVRPGPGEPRPAAPGAGPGPTGTRPTRPAPGGTPAPARPGAGSHDDGTAAQADPREGVEGALRAAVRATAGLPTPDARGAADLPAQVPGPRSAGASLRAGWQPVRPAVVSSRSAERFAERVRMRRRLTRRRLLLAGSALVVVGTLAWVLLGSSLLALDLTQLRVEGQGTVVEPAAVEAVVEPYGGVPLPRLDTVGLRRQILEVPGVRAAEVTREWPHGLRVALVSREPVVAVPDPDSGFALLDTEGVRVGSAPAPPAGLPVVQVPLDDPQARALTAVLTVLEQLPDDLAAQVTAVAAETRDAVELELVDGVLVEWGSADRTALKARVLQTLRTAETSRGARVFDVSAPELPITSS